MTAWILHTYLLRFSANRYINRYIIWKRGFYVASLVFGPVPSRRLGRSLGVDLVPFKTCSYDCIYCQLGRTTCKTVERKQWMPMHRLLEDLEKKLDTRPDYITLSGSGEPTLFKPLDKLIDGIRAMTDVPIAVLTNGSLLHLKEVQRELLKVDLAVPSLDAGSEKTFRLVNRPHESISFEQMLAGLIEFRRIFDGPYWLEVFIIGAYTTFEQELAEIRRCVERIQPDRVQLNTVTRPPAESYAATVPREQLEEIAATFSPPAEVIADFRTVAGDEVGRAGREEILQLLQRRPCSIDDIVGGLTLHRNEVLKHVEHLCADGFLEESRVGGKLYYKAAGQ
ncbi:MAG: radical SAM protein [Pirellulaceae bacterium]|nr:radical SAM protein [Pirellulaceae bacterium]